MNFIKKIFKTNSILYYYWFNMFRKAESNSLRLPESGDDLYFDGYPRSGNTYSYWLLVYFYPNLKITHHLHTIGALKIAIQKKIKCLIIIRNPLDCVSSFYFTKTYEDNNGDISHEILKNLLVDYIEYYQFVAINNLKVLKFDDLLFNQKFVIQNFSEILSSDSIEESKIDSEIKKFEMTFKKKEKHKKLTYSSLPKPERENFKNKIKKELNKYDLMDKALSIYFKLSDN